MPRHVGKPEVLDEPEAARAAEYARIEEDLGVHDHPTRAEVHGRRAHRDPLTLGVVQPVPEAVRPPAAHRLGPVLSLKLSHHRRAEVVIVIDEHGGFMALLAKLPRQVETSEATDIPRTVEYGHVDTRPRCRVINGLTVRTVVPDHGLHRNILCSKELEHLRQTFEPHPRAKDDRQLFADGCECEALIAPPPQELHPVLDVRLRRAQPPFDPPLDATGAHRETTLADERPRLRC